MLPLNDPLWEKLDDAHPELLSKLAETWDDEAADSLFWDCLCHQESCYGATYAALPHLLKIAQPDGNGHQRLEIALFSGFVTLCALRPRSRAGRVAESKSLPGLPLTLDAWDRKLDCFRSLLASIEHRNRFSSRYEQLELLPRYKTLLAIEPIHAGDLEKIRSIQADFISALPKIRAVCERALLENIGDTHAVLHIPSGIAAADGLHNPASLLDSGSEGQFSCTSCGWRYQYILFEDRVAIYAHEGADETRSIHDFKQHAPSRCDGFIVPVADNEALDSRTAARLSQRTPSAQPALLLRNFLGSFHCCKCNAHGPIQAICF
jgi:hypothetical protein